MCIVVTRLPRLKTPARFCEMASAHGIRTHNAIKALHLDHLFGSATGGCKPGADIKVIDKKFAASEAWDGNLKLGQSGRLPRHGALHGDG